MKIELILNEDLWRTLTTGVNISLRELPDATDRPPKVVMPIIDWKLVIDRECQDNPTISC